MVLWIREDSQIPIYQQIRNQIVKGISEGQLKPGEQLPTVRALALEMGINVMTVSRAYQMLRQEGYILADRRNGARVRESFSGPPRLSAPERETLEQLISEARLRGVPLSEITAACRQFYGGDERSGEGRNRDKQSGGERSGEERSGGEQSGQEPQRRPVPEKEREGDTC